jgi:hypothetical protein
MHHTVGHGREHLGGLELGQPSEVTQLDQLCQPRLDGREPVQCLVHAHDLAFGGPRTRREMIGQRHVCDRATRRLVLRRRARSTITERMTRPAHLMK